MFDPKTLLKFGLMSKHAWVQVSFLLSEKLQHVTHFLAPQSNAL